MKTHQGLQKRIKLSNPKKGKRKMIFRSKGRGSTHLMDKKSSSQKRRRKNPNVKDVTKKVKALTNK